MRVEGPASPAGPARPRRSSSSTGNFESLLQSASAPASAEPEAGAPLTDSAGLASLTALLSAQSTEALAQADGMLGGLDEDEVRDRQARRHGKAMLEALAGLQLGMLDGNPTPILAQLAELAKAAPEAADPVLRLILREINIRAAVELARPA